MNKIIKCFLKIKNFSQDISLVLYNKLFSSKYVLKGKCKKCGSCCRNILFSTKEGFIKDEKTFEEIKKKYRYYRNFKISGKIKDKQDFQNGALTFECKYINKNNRCKIYFLRPDFCKKYPKINSLLVYNGVTMLDECGYYYEIDKKFKDYYV